MARRHPILRGLLRWLVLAPIAVAVVALVVAKLAGVDTGPSWTLGKSLGVVEVRGVINNDLTDVLEALDGFRRNDHIVGIVVRIDSPGGAVTPAQEVYDAIWRVRRETTKPVVASLGNVAASAGYYIASAANVIVSDPGTLTGSIGALMEIPQLGPLADKLGVGQEIIKSGPLKAAGNPLRPLTDEERALLQGIVDDTLQQFIEAVASGRGLEVDQIRALADGRTFSGKQALAVGLVDKLGGFEVATREAWERAKQTGEPKIQRVKAGRRPWWLDVLGKAMTTDTLPASGGLFFIYPGPTLQ